MQPADGCRPAQIKSCWPDVPPDEWFAYGANKARERYRATIDQMDELQLVTETWLPLITDIRYRKIINLRMLRNPYRDDRPVLNWARIAEKIQKDRSTAKRWYKEALEHLTERLNQTCG